MSKTKTVFVGRQRYEMRRVQCSRSRAAACNECRQHGGHVAIYKWNQISADWMRVAGRSLPGCPPGYEPARCARAGCPHYVGPNMVHCSSNCRRLVGE